MRTARTWMAMAGLAVAATGVSAWACDKEKPCCAKKKAAAMAAAGASADGRSETVDVAKPCAHAETASAKAPCGKKCDENCAKNCPHAKSRLAAMAEAEKPCAKRETVSAILASLPSIQYRVGDETTSCPKHAKALASAGGSLQYVVGDDLFQSEDEATARLASLIEAEANELQAVHFVVGDESYLCPMSAKNAAAAAGKQIVYRVGASGFDTREKADKAVELAKAAVSHVQMTYRVGEESFQCDRMAGAKAEEVHKPIVYEINGESTPCAVTAMKLLAEAKLRAVIEAASTQVGS